MSNKLIPGLLITGAIAAVWLTGKSKTAEALQYFPKSFKFTGGLTNPVLILKMEVVNPTTRTLEISNIFANVYANQSMIGRIEYLNKIFLPTGTTAVNIPVQLFSGGVASLLVEIITGVKKIDLKLLGTVNAEGFSTALNETIPVI